MVCLHCGKKVGVLRKMQKAEFCSEAHRKAYGKKQNDDALDFLLKSKPRLRPKKVSPASHREPSGPPAPEPKPLLVLAEFVREAVTPGTVQASPLRTAQPVRAKGDTILPAVVRLTTPVPRVSHFASTTVSADGAPDHARAVSQSSARFPVARPGLRDDLVRPIWLRPERPAPVERPRAGFVAIRPTAIRPAWMHLAPKPERAGVVARRTVAPALVHAEFAPNSPTVRLARASRPSIQSSGGAAQALERQGSTWQSHTAVVQTPSAAMTVRVSGPRMCAQIPTSPPPARSAEACNSAAITFRPMNPREQPLVQTLKLVLAGPSLQSAPRAPIDLPRPAAARGTAIAGNRETLVLKSEIRLGPFTRVGTIRPSFNVPDSTEPLPIAACEPRIRVSTRLAERWRSVPPWSRRLAITSAAAAMLWMGASRLKISASVRDARDTMAVRISQRAAVEFQDDFRSGLSQWTGAPGWANSWSYDGTGFARPGHLALLAGSLPMDDYRFEFIAQIEKRALGWVYRASDPHNYYAMKLVQSKHGAGAVYSIVHYAVIDGHQRLKVELPLPIAASSKTLIRVRQEIRDEQFTTYLDGQLVDTWSDATLRRGGIGFFADPGEAAYVRWVDVAHNDDALGRLCSYLTAASPR